MPPHALPENVAVPRQRPVPVCVSLSHVTVPLNVVVASAPSSLPLISPCPSLFGVVMRHVPAMDRSACWSSACTCALYIPAGGWPGMSPGAGVHWKRIVPFHAPAILATVGAGGGSGAGGGWAGGWTGVGAVGALLPLQLMASRALRSAAQTR